ncbi:MAG: hypothetical protein IJW55_03510 [Clostridia bacterium]|nr:hypothetical protein [Clostridia bacterium]
MKKLKKHSIPSVLLAIAICATMIVPMFAVGVAAEPIAMTADTAWYADDKKITDENGTSWYVISDADDLAGLASIVDAGTDDFKDDYIKLGGDITFNEGSASDWANGNNLPVYLWEPIGSTAYPFRGTFDGNHNTISGIYMNETSATDTALFSILDNATVQNVKIENSYFASATNRLAALVGRTMSSSNEQNIIDNCHIGSNVYVVNTIKTNGVAGIVASVGLSSVVDTSTTISNCSSSATISGLNRVGAMVGQIQNAGSLSISNCVNNGTVTATSTSSTDMMAGGMIGYLISCTNAVTITNCTNTGTISSQKNAGGAVGYNAAETTVNISGFLNTGDIDSGAANNVGEVIGGLYGTASVSNSVALGSTKGNAGQGLFVGYAGATAAFTFSDSYAVDDGTRNVIRSANASYQGDYVENAVENGYAIQISTYDGASIRMSSDTSSTGIRFITQIINKDIITALEEQGYTVSIGTLVALGKDITDASAFETATTVDVEATVGAWFTKNVPDATATYFAGSVNEIPAAQYTTDLSAIGYITLTKDGTSATCYSAAYVTRNIAEIAEAAYNDTNGGYSTEELAILANFFGS